MPATIFFIFDEYGTTKQGRVEIDFPSSITRVTAGELAIAFADLMGKFTHGKISKAGVTYELDLGVDSDFSSTNILADLRDKARFAFRASGAAGDFVKRLTIPTYDEDFTLPGDDKPIDVDDPVIDAFIDAMISGVAVTAGTIQPIDSREYDIWALDYAREVD